MQKVITFGEIMLRLSPPGYRRFSQAHSFEAHFGGGEANVAVALANLGLPVEFITRLPENEMGHSTVMELRKRGVGTTNIIFGGERLGIYFLEKGAVHRGSKIIYDRSHSSFSTIKKRTIDWDEVFQDAQWFHWTGITPALSQNAADVCLEALEAANDLDITVSTDLSYRSKLWNYGKKPEEVMPGLVKRCDIILASSYAAEQYFGIQVEASGKNFDASNHHLSLCKQLMDHFPRAKKIVSTIRESKNASLNRYTGVLYDGTDLLEAPNYEITHMVDRVGGGDAFMGGLIYGLLTYNSDQKALEFAAAASALKHTIPGDANLANVAEIEDLMAGESSGRVSR